MIGDNSKEYPLLEKPLHGPLLSILLVLSSSLNSSSNIQVKYSRWRYESGNYGRFGALLDSRIASHA